MRQQTSHSYFWRMLFQVITRPLNEKSYHILMRILHFLLIIHRARDIEWWNTSTYREVAPHDSACTHLMEQTRFLCSVLAFARRIWDCGAIATEICSQGWFFVAQIKEAALQRRHRSHHRKTKVKAQIESCIFQGLTQMRKLTLPTCLMSETVMSTAIKEGRHWGGSG